MAGPSYFLNLPPEDVENLANPIFGEGLMGFQGLTNFGALEFSNSWRPTC